MLIRLVLLLTGICLACPVTDPMQDPVNKSIALARILENFPPGKELLGLRLISVEWNMAVLSHLTDTAFKIINMSNNKMVESDELIAMISERLEYFWRSKLISRAIFRDLEVRTGKGLEKPFMSLVQLVATNVIIRMDLSVLKLPSGSLKSVDSGTEFDPILQTIFENFSKDPNNLIEACKELRRISDNHKELPVRIVRYIDTIELLNLFIDQEVLTDLACIYGALKFADEDIFAKFYEKIDDVKPPVEKYRQITAFALEFENFDEYKMVEEKIPGALSAKEKAERGLRVACWKSKSLDTIGHFIAEGADPKVRNAFWAGYKSTPNLFHAPDIFDLSPIEILKLREDTPKEFFKCFEKLKIKPDRKFITLRRLKRCKSSTPTSCLIKDFKFPHRLVRFNSLNILYALRSDLTLEIIEHPSIDVIIWPDMELQCKRVCTFFGDKVVLRRDGPKTLGCKWGLFDHNVSVDVLEVEELVEIFY